MLLGSDMYFALPVVPNPFTDSDTRQIEVDFSRVPSRRFLCQLVRTGYTETKKKKR
jgi:hypothetical protein